MYCKNCGIKLDDDVKFCPECGTKVQISVSGGTDSTQDTMKCEATKTVSKNLQTKIEDSDEKLTSIKATESAAIEELSKGTPIKKEEPIKTTAPTEKNVTTQEPSASKADPTPIIAAETDKKQKKGISKKVVCNVIGGIVLALIIAVAVVGITKNMLNNQNGIAESGEQISDGKDNNSYEKIKSAPKIEDIDWSVSEGIRSGKRSVILTFTNNSDFVLKELEFKFSEKPNISVEDKEAFYAEYSKIADLDEKESEELKTREVSMTANCYNIINPGETVNNINFDYFGSAFYMDNINYYNLVEPDILTLEYISDGLIHTIYYDFKTKKYTEENYTEEAQEWFKEAFGNNKLPRISVGVINIMWDFDTSCLFYAEGITQDDYNNYVNECKEKGFSQNAIENNTSYEADDSEGCHISLEYDVDDRELRCELEQ